MGISKNILSLTLAAGVLLCAGGCRERTLPAGNINYTDQRFRDKAVSFARETVGAIFSGRAVEPPEELSIPGAWQAAVDVYGQGKVIAHGQGEAGGSDEALENAVLRAVKSFPGLTEEGFRETRFLISVSRDRGKPFSFVEYEKRGIELAADLTTVRYLDKKLMLKKIVSGKEYLLRSMNADKHAFYKKYFVLGNTFGNKLRTIYTASSLLTLLRVNDIEPDERIDEEIPKIAGFLLSMQSLEGPSKGAFHYSVSADTAEKDGLFVVGTASKTIFTLLDLYRRGGDVKYLDSADSAGEWLLTMQQPDGSMANYMEYKNGGWVYGKKFSCLYTGQVLSAFSRLYGPTGDIRYYDAAKKLAGRIADKASRDDFFIRDDYRVSGDPVPTSWAVMSLLDFYKISGDDFYKDVLLKCTDKLLAIQLGLPEDIMEYGRFQGSIASGTGWITEILTEVHNFGKEKNWAGTKRYEQAVIKAVRWLVQNTYSPENTYFIQDPARVFGGIIRNYSEETIRTDAVCHGVNGYLGILKHLEGGPLIEVPETDRIGK